MAAWSRPGAVEPTASTARLMPPARNEEKKPQSPGSWPSTTAMIWRSAEGWGGVIWGV